MRVALSINGKTFLVVIFMIPSLSLSFDSAGLS